MNETINSFLDFYNPNKENELFLISQSISSALEILKGKFSGNSINLNLELDETLKTTGVKMELAQVIINIVSNSIDVFIEREIKDRLISIKLFEKDSQIMLILEDNGGGIVNDQIERILDPYYTTKETGTGIGLYMVRLIIENNFKGELKVINSDNGLKFIILLNN